jgi:hypothetical protein
MQASRECYLCRIGATFGDGAGSDAGSGIIAKTAKTRMTRGLGHDVDRRPRVGGDSVRAVNGGVNHFRERRRLTRLKKCGSGRPSRRVSSTHGCRAILKLSARSAWRRTRGGGVRTPRRLPRTWDVGRPVSPLERGRWGNFARMLMWCRRNPVVAGTTGLAATALVTVAAVSLIYADQRAKASSNIVRLANSL